MLLRPNSLDRILCYIFSGRSAVQGLRTPLSEHKAAPRAWALSPILKAGMNIPHMLITASMQFEIPPVVATGSLIPFASYLTKTYFSFSPKDCIFVFQLAGKGAHRQQLAAILR